MPISRPWNDPTGGTIQDPYIYCSSLAIDFAKGRGRIELSVHRDQASAYAGKFPVEIVGIDIGPDSVGTIPSLNELIGANQSAFTELATAIYTLALGQSEFSGATVI